MWDKNSKKVVTSDGLATANPITIPVKPEYEKHQIEVFMNDGDGTMTAGTIAFYHRSNAKAEWQPVLVSGSPYVMTIAAGGTRTLTVTLGKVGEFRLVPGTTIAGGGSPTAYGAEYHGGR